MENVNEVIFSRTRANKKVAIINSLNEDELFKVTLDSIKRIAKELANEYGYHCIARERRAGNNWNSTIDRIDYNKKTGDVTLEVYVQNSSTDSSYFDNVRRFLNSGSIDYVENFNYLNQRVRYDRSDRSRVIKSILLEYVYYKWIEKPERERQALITKYQDMGSDIYETYYKDNRLSYIYIDNYTSDRDIIRKEGYNKGRNGVRTWLETDGNYKTLKGKTDEEIKEIIKDKFFGAIEDYRKSFNRKEYFKGWFF